MAIFRITPATSVVTGASGTYAFTSDSLGADTLIVDLGAFMISTALTSQGGAFLANTGAWTVTVNGSIFTNGDTGPNFGIGLLLAAGNTAVSTITIGADGEVGGGRGITAASAATIKNAGVITGEGIGIALFNGGVHTITNSGTINGSSYSIIDWDGLSIDKVTNSGTLNSKVDLGGGNDTLTNSGQINGFVTLADGNDVFTNFVTDASGTRSGTVTGIIGMGLGDNKFFGGSNAEVVLDGGGADIVKLGGGNDTYNAANTSGDGKDVVDGGIGIDTYIALNASLVVNLDKVAHDLSPISGLGDVAAKTAIGTDINGASSTDIITGFENAQGGGSGDLLYGNAAANLLAGGGSGDNLLGYGGNDTLLGEDGADGLAGGAGKDILTGGSAGDFFQFLCHQRQRRHQGHPRRDHGFSGWS